MGFRGKSFSAKSSPHEDLQGEKGQTTREVTKINHTLYVEQISKHFFFLLHSDGIFYRAKWA